jgi:uncharacterized protein
MPFIIMINGMTNDEEKVISHNEICLYLDFYGQLLTDHCRDILEMHYSEDMSLSEIAETLGITRQAVHDRIRQGSSQLTAYEKALGLSARFQTAREYIRLAMKALDNGQASLARENLMQLEAVL